MSKRNLIHGTWCSFQIQNITCAALSEEVAEKTQGLRYNLSSTFHLNFCCFTCMNPRVCYYILIGSINDRRLKGEEIQDLGMEELDELEKLIEAGLSRVENTKV